LHLGPSFLKTRAVGWRDKLSGAGMVWLGMRIDEDAVLRLDEMSALELLLRQGVKPRLIQWFWATACMAVLNVPLERCSAGALMRVFAQLIGRARYQFGFPKVGLAELYASQAARQIHAAGGEVHIDAPVRRIAVGAAGVAHLLLDDGTRVRAHHYVSAVPPQDLQKLLPADWQRMPPFRDLPGFEPSPYISTYLWLDRKVTDTMFWARIWRTSDLNSDFYDLSLIRPQTNSEGSLIASNMIYAHRAQGMSDAEIISRTLHELRQAAPGARAAQVRHAVVNRIPMAIPCPQPGTERKRPHTVSPIRGLLLAGDWTRTELPASMESAVHAGFAAAEEVWRRIGRPQELVQAKGRPQGLAALVNQL
jgi:15-cis-phytoene desaturase